MHKRFFFSASLLLVAVTAAAHRGVGIVMDSRGTVFYTDLSQVWKIEPGGRKTVAVANVHTHELYLDGDDNLYGEHLWYEGEATDRGGHYVWKRHADGKLERIISAHNGFRDVRCTTCSANGIVDLVDSGDLHRIDAAGSVSTLAQYLSERRLW